MSTITLSCLVMSENPYENAFEVNIGINKSISKLKNAIKEKKQNDFANVDADKLKLWKVNISFEKENKKLELINTKINVNIRTLMVRNFHFFRRLVNTFPLSQPTNTYI